MINTVITGASGRMGQSLVRLLAESQALRLHAAVDAPGSGSIGNDAGKLAGIEPNGIIVAAELAPALPGAQLLIDFSVAGATTEHVRSAQAAKVAMLIGTTGLSAGTLSAIEAAARDIAILPASNTSLSVALLALLVERAAGALGPEFNIEILEAHHKYKLDAPSGTALTLAEAAARGRGTTYAASRVSADRSSTGTRSDATIGIASIRGGDVVGDHEVAFLGPGERVVLRHSATDRVIFARGALKAGQWLSGKPAGRYQMADVFRL
jgi:4-hydroxy-tetrahydrodipicolinate reductase